MALRSHILIQLKHNPKSLSFDVCYMNDRADLELSAAYPAQYGWSHANQHDPQWQRG